MEKVYILIILSSIFNLCSTPNYKSEFNEIDYHLESHILFDLIKYYKVDFGEYPYELKDLKKLFKSDSINYSGLNSLNLFSNIKDPFVSDSYRYVVLDENSFILYSVGPDGVDNNTAVMDNYSKTGNIAFEHYDQKSSTGDILIYHLENNKIINDFTKLDKIIENGY